MKREYCTQTNASVTGCSKGCFLFAEHTYLEHVVQYDRTMYVRGGWEERFISEIGSARTSAETRGDGTCVPCKDRYLSVGGNVYSAEKIRATLEPLVSSIDLLHVVDNDRWCVLMPTSLVDAEQQSSGFLSKRRVHLKHR